MPKRLQSVEAHYRQTQSRDLSVTAELLIYTAIILVFLSRLIAPSFASVVGLLLQLFTRSHLFDG